MKKKIEKKSIKINSINFLNFHINQKIANGKFSRNEQFGFVYVGHNRMEMSELEVTAAFFSGWTIE